MIYLSVSKYMVHSGLNVVFRPNSVHVSDKGWVRLPDSDSCDQDLCTGLCSDNACSSFKWSSLISRRAPNYFSLHVYNDLITRGDNRSDNSDTHWVSRSCHLDPSEMLTYVCLCVCVYMCEWLCM